MIIAAPTLFATDRRTFSRWPRPVGTTPTLASGFEAVDEVAYAPRHPRDRVELREEPGEELVRLEAPFRLGDHHLDRVLLEQRDRVELRVERPRD
jgi:hypothetical protein